MPLSAEDAKLLGIVTFDTPKTTEEKESFAKDIGRPLEGVDILAKVTSGIQKIKKTPLQIASEKVTELAKGRALADIPTRHKGSHLSDDDNAYWDAVAELNKLFHESKG